VSQERFRCPWRPPKQLPPVEEEVRSLEQEISDGGTPLKDGVSIPGEHSDPEGLQEEYLKVAVNVQSCEVGDLSRRGKPKCQGVRLNESAESCGQPCCGGVCKGGTKPFGCLTA